MSVADLSPCKRERIRSNGKLWWNGCSVACGAPSKASCPRIVPISVVSFWILYQILAIKSIIRSCPACQRTSWTEVQRKKHIIGSLLTSWRYSPLLPQTLMKRSKWEVVIQTFILMISHCCAPALSQAEMKKKIILLITFSEGLLKALVCCWYHHRSWQTSEMKPICCLR